MNYFRGFTLFLMFLLVSSVTLANFSYGDVSDIDSKTKKVTNEKQPSDKKSSKEAKKTLKQNNAKNIDSKLLMDLYAANKWAEYSKDLLAEVVKQDTKKLKKQTAPDKSIIKNNEKISKDLTKLGDQIKKTESEIKKEAKTAKISSADLNKSAKEPIDKLKSKNKMTVDERLEEAKNTLGKLDSIIDDIKYTGGVDPDKTGKSNLIPDDLKDLPGLDNTVELKVENKGGIFDGDNCKGTGLVNIHWKLVDPKGNTPKKPTALNVMGLDRNGHRIGLIYMTNVAIIGGLFENMKDAKYDKTGTYNLASDTAWRIWALQNEKKIQLDESFKISIPVTFTPDEKEQVFTFEIASLYGPENHVYSGDRDKITVKIPACQQKPVTSQEPKQAPQEPEPKVGIDSVVDDLQHIVVIDQDGNARPVEEQKMIKDLYGISNTLYEILDKVEQTREEAKKTQPAKTSENEKTTIKSANGISTKDEGTKKISKKDVNSDELVIINAYSIVTSMSSKKPSDLDVLRQVKNQLTTQEYRTLVDFLDSRIEEKRNSVPIPLKNSSPITDAERAQVLAELSSAAVIPSQFFNEQTNQKPSTEKNKPDFEILLKPDSMRLPRGGYGEVDVTVKSLNGWDDKVWLNIPIPIGPIRYPSIVPNLVTPTPSSDADAAFAVDVSLFSCPGKYRMAVYGMTHDQMPMEISYTYFNLEIIDPGKIFELSTDQKTITIQKGGFKSFALVVKNLDNTDHAYLIDTNKFKAPAGVTIEHKNTISSTSPEQTNKGTITIKTSSSIKTPLTFTLPLRAMTALNCEPTPTEITSVTVNIVGDAIESTDQVLVPGSETKPMQTPPSNTKPTLSIPKQVTQEATGPAGANVVFSTSSSDKEDGSLTPVCTPSSGSTFPIGATSVSCIVTDSNNNSVSGSFTITVRDTTPPAFASFQPTEGVRDNSGVQVFFDVTANDLVDGNVPVSCNYQSGYKFPPGITELKCATSDSRGNQSTKTVQITVTITESGQ